MYIPTVVDGAVEPSALRTPAPSAVARDSQLFQTELCAGPSRSRFSSQLLGGKMLAEFFSVFPTSILIKKN